MDASRLLQLQTRVAYASNGSQSQGAREPPSARSSFSSGRSNPSSSSPSPAMSAQPSMADYIRCSRCQRSLSIDANGGSLGGMVKFGTNLYYCSRCASVVGFKK